MPRVAAQLLGPPNPRYSSRHELRFGSNGGISIDLEKGTFYNHETKSGGGVLDLIMLQRRCTKAAAVDWLKDQGFPADDYKPKANGHAEPTTSSPKNATAPPRPNLREPDKVYAYTDETGAVLFEVCRYSKPSKSFRQRRKANLADPPEKTLGGYVYSVKGVPQVPYRLPELLEAVALGHTIHVVEGEKDADNLRALGVPATTNAMGAGKWPQELTPHFEGAQVVILPDHDEAGEAHLAVVGEALAGVAASVRVLRLPDLSNHQDVSDWLAKDHTADELAALVEGARTYGEADPTHLPFGAVWFKDAGAQLEEPEWLVDDLLTRGDMSLIYGASQSGKSFLATHLAMGVSRGTPVFERKVHQGGVVYIAAEGRKGFKKRLKAYAQHNNIAFDEDLPFVLVPSKVDLFAKEGADVGKLLEALATIEIELAKRALRVELIVVDTWAAVSPGANENASEDVSRVVKNVERFREACASAHIMIVHHKNAGGERPRGHTSLYAGIDNAIEVTIVEGSHPVRRAAKIEKMKDGEDGFELGFKLHTVELGQRADGKPITSCVVVAHDDNGNEQKTKGAKLSDQQRIALQALREALLDHGEPAPGALQLPFGLKVVRAEHWKREFLKRGFDETANESTFRMAFKRVGEALLARAIIGRDMPFVWIVREPSR